jgi:hypothetical protein
VTDGSNHQSEGSNGYRAFYSVQPFEKVSWQFLDELISFYYLFAGSPEEINSVAATIVGTIVEVS